jgi:hypothetical protein
MANRGRVGDIKPQSSLKNTFFTSAVSHFDYFRNERSKRADMKAMDTNKLILRLERLMTSLPVDPVSKSKLFLPLLINTFEVLVPLPPQGTSLLPYSQAND